ncbi:hypothetical protein HAX54_046457 [Datura stramonium]|uniref:Uncharacterized protein n=1 Tax=Datura stramonium TaxID=4076 RepID=A0ABS8WJI9_DATST|nr:hypothetical protein [Datura stramonium]
MEAYEYSMVEGNFGYNFLNSMFGINYNHTLFLSVSDVSGIQDLLSGKVKMIGKKEEGLYILKGNTDKEEVTLATHISDHEVTLASHISEHILDSSSSLDIAYGVIDLDMFTKNNFEEITTYARHISDTHTTEEVQAAMSPISLHVEHKTDPSHDVDSVPSQVVPSSVHIITRRSGRERKPPLWMTFFVSLSV